MKQNQFYRYILIISIVLLAGLNAKVLAPIGNEEKIKLTMGEREWIYYKLDKDGLIYNDIGGQYNINDSIQVEIHSRTIIGSNSKNTKKYGFTVQINGNEPIELKYKKNKSKLKNSDRPSWDYTKKGVWYLYLPVQDLMNLGITPIDRKHVFLQVTTSRIKKKGKIKNVLQTVNYQNKIKIKTVRTGNQKKDPIITSWYALDEENQQQFRIRGPSKVRVFSRILFDDEQIKNAYYLLVKENGIDLGTYYFTTEISNESLVVKSQKPVSKWRSVWLTIPEGKHYYTFTLPNIEDNLEKMVYIRLKEWQEEQ